MLGAATAPLLGSTVLALRVHDQLRGPKGDYLGLLAAALASWAGVPGPGEAALVTAGILASKHRLDLPSVLAVAWVGATVGGTIGWLVGLKAGRAVVTAPGPLLRLRRVAVARGEGFFERYGPVAVFFTPSWVAGVYGMRWRQYLVANAIAALVWTLMIGVGSYALGPSITEVVSDVGLAGSLVIGTLIVGAIAAAVIRRSRRARRG